MATSDFAIVEFFEQLGDSAVNSRDWKFVGDSTEAKDFNISGEPVGDGYVLIEVAGIEGAWRPNLYVNDQKMALGFRGFDSMFSNSLEFIPEGFLKQGSNTISIKRHPSCSDGKIFITYAIIHWKQAMVDKALHAVQSDEADHAKEADHATTAYYARGAGKLRPDMIPRA